MKLSRRGRIVGFLAIGIVVAIAVMIVWPSSAWELSSATGIGRCPVRRGWTQQAVAQACGPPDAVGIQPKVQSDRAPKEWISFCSAPCEIRRDRIVFYDCRGGVADVGHVHRAYNDGCVRPYASRLDRLRGFLLEEGVAYDGRVAASRAQLFALPKQ